MAQVLPCETVAAPPDFAGLGLTWIGSIDVNGDGTPIGSAGIVSTGDTVYASTGNLYVATQKYDPNGGLWLNLLHLHGSEVMFARFVDYPMAVINWHDRDTAPTLGEALAQFPGALCGGLQRDQTMVLGNPVSVTAEAHDAIQATGGRRFILGTGCVLPTTAPRGNILAARRAIEEVSIE